MLKQRLDFPFENNIETTDRLAKMPGEKKLMKQLLDYPFENKIETMDRLAKRQDREIVETVVRFFI